MANFHVIRTARLTDRKVLDLIYALHADNKATSGTIVLGDGMNVDPISCERNEKPVSDLNRDRHAIRSAHLSTSSNIHIHFYRGISGDTQDPQTNRQASPYFDEVFLRHDPKRGGATPQQWIDCIDTIETALPKTYPLQEIRQGSDVIDVLRVEMAGLAGQYKEMLAGLADERAKFREESEEERKFARQEYAVAQNRLEVAGEDQRKEFDAYKQEEEGRLQQQREELDRREQDLDNRQHMHARRELRERISDDFKARVVKPVVSRAAFRMRWLVFGLTLAAGVGIGVFGIESFGELTATGGNEAAPGWLTITHAVRSVVLIALAVGFVAYAISWLRAIYLDDVRAERRYEKYGYDIDRASFVIETIMEVGDKENMQVPDAWTDGVCRNLFEDNADRSPDNNPNHALAALFETISGAKFGPDGAELSMGRRDARRFAKKHSGG